MVLTAVPFITVIFMGIIVILISRTLDVLWAQVLPMRFFYSLLRAPGVIIHELSHVLGCLISGAKVKKVIYFSNEGGSVTYSSPKIPYIGDLVINIAPLFCIPLILAGCTGSFQNTLGVYFRRCHGVFIQWMHFLECLPVFLACSLRISLSVSIHGSLSTCT